MVRLECLSAWLSFKFCDHTSYPLFVSSIFHPVVPCICHSCFLLGTHTLPDTTAVRETACQLLQVHYLFFACSPLSISVVVLVQCWSRLTDSQVCTHAPPILVSSCFCPVRGGSRAGAAAIRHQCLWNEVKREVSPEPDPSQTPLFSLTIMPLFHGTGILINNSSRMTLCLVSCILDKQCGTTTCAWCQAAYQWGMWNVIKQDPSVMRISAASMQPHVCNDGRMTVSWFYNCMHSSFLLLAERISMFVKCSENSKIFFFTDWIIFKGSKKIICFYIYVLKITFHWSTYVIRKCHSLLSVSVMWSLFLLYVFPKHSLFNVKVSQVRTFPLLIISGFCLGFSFTTWLTTQAGANTDGVKGIVHPFITYNFVDVAFSNIL